jgi:hypothetical protein
MWIDDGVLPNIDATEFISGKLVHAVDRQSIKQALDLWRVLRNVVIEKGGPLPTARMIVPVVVALWNRCKGPIDLYSRFLRNVQAKHKKLPATGAVWLRLIMTTVCNAYQSYSLYVSLEYLLSEDCKCFLDFQRYRNKNSGSFRKFCMLLACNMLTIDCEGIASVLSTRSIQARRLVTYNQRELFMEGREYFGIRMDTTIAHFAVPNSLFAKDTETDTSRSSKTSVTPQRRCMICCRNNHDDGSKPLCKKRLGFKTTMECYVCKVPLCMIKRYNNQSCFEIFHSKATFPVVCVPASESGLMVRRRMNAEASANVGHLNVADTPSRVNSVEEISQRNHSSPRFASPTPITQKRSSRGSAAFEVPIAESPRQRKSQRLSDGNKVSRKNKESCHGKEKQKGKKNDSLERNAKKHSRTIDLYYNDRSLNVVPKQKKQKKN